jgi:hypothetical protein
MCGGAVWDRLTRRAEGPSALSLEICHIDGILPHPSVTSRPAPPRVPRSAAIERRPAPRTGAAYASRPCLGRAPRRPGRGGARGLAGDRPVGAPSRRCRPPARLPRVPAPRRTPRVRAIAGTAWPPAPQARDLRPGSDAVGERRAGQRAPDRRLRSRQVTDGVIVVFEAGGETVRRPRCGRSHRPVGRRAAVFRSSAGTRHPRACARISAALVTGGAARVWTWYGPCSIGTYPGERSATGVEPPAPLSCPGRQRPHGSRVVGTAHRPVVPGRNPPGYGGWS